MDGVGDELLLELAKEIGNASNVRRLGLKLGFTLSDTDTFVETNKLHGSVTSEGTLQMLRRWRDNTPTSNQRNVLKTALENAQLSELADIHFNQSRTNGGQREEHTRKRFRSELSDTTEEKDAIVTEEVVEMVEMEKRRMERRKRMERMEKEMRKRMEKEMKIMCAELERRYTDSRRFQKISPLHVQGFLPLLKRRNGYQSSSSALENSRHDIFSAQLARKQLRRIVVSHNSPGESTALCHSLAYDWATQNRSSRLSEMQFLFELSCSEIKPNQTIEAAIKDQLFSECDQIDETLIKELIEKMPDGVTILLDGYNGNNVMEDILTGRILKEVTVMLTAKPRSANLLHRMASGVYENIDMY